MIDGFFALVWSGLLNAVTPYNLLVCFIGVAVGIAVGALPGISSTTACALLVPFTFAMEPATGLILLGSIWTAAIYGGSNAACLLNIPGTPSSIATAFEGYPMTQKGEAERAMCIALFASVFGGVVGVLILLVAFAPLAELSVRIGSPEYFWLCIFGLSTIASLSYGNSMKGLLSGGIGLMIGTVGLDPVIGTPRFTFGVDALVEGIQLVPALIGIFAFSQVLQLTEQRSALIGEYKAIPHLLRSVLGELAQKRKMNLMRSSLIGTFIGMLPGAGGPVASLISYNEAKRWDQDPQRFGTGITEGIVASESANNAVIGASLIPMLGLGIPGCPTAAIVMGGLLVHGIIPGPALLTESADVAYTFITSLLIANILLIFIGFFMLRLSANLLRMPMRWIIPMVVVIAVMGTYSLHSSMVDVYVMIGCGVGAFLLSRVGISTGPMALGLVLGPIIENSLNVSLQLAQARGDYFEIFFMRPVSLLFITLTVVSLVLPIVQEKYRLRKFAEAS
ncbi:tripartite tricarboxylate transporter permease [Pseudohoeflea coraliihabitans]|uniref:Tripartite tricarboxylate transporter permease n=1 Tax=Pseudohoeflea coraliihabitans TaxID=2860393 RepID=A0ABS6WMM0_9HYPH|nr:tripartite tricarboxylate transporter permease [Pseudohoeflea sp. DP4N28-3]MBW3097194.1 tripartite tricarboxylate transporter permease [Pseudohoeflea sp. DP4N28-3]